MATHALKAELATKADVLSQTSVKTSAYTASPNDLVLADTSSGEFAITLPAAPADKTIVCIKKVDSSTTNRLTVSCGGSDTFFAPAGVSLLLRLQGQTGTWMYSALTAKWVSISSVVQLTYLVDNLSDQDVYGKKSFYDDVIVTDGKNIVIATATGTKIGTSTNQKIGFFNATPVTQPSGPLLTALANLGLVGSPTIAQADVTGLTSALAAKQASLTLTTTGTSGPATLSGGILNIPSYSGGGSSSPLTTKGDIWGFSTTDARIPIGSDNFVLTADSTQTLGVKWAASPSGFANPMTTAGDIIYENGTPAPARLAAGTATQVLHSGSTPSWGAISLTADVSGILPIASGGTGSTTQNFVDLTTAQSVAGIKTFSSLANLNGGISISSTTTIGNALRATTASRTSTSTLTSTSGWNNVCDATSGAITLTLPAASSFVGQMFWFKKIDASANAVTISRAGSDTIDGATTYVLSTQYKYVELISNGTAWYVRENN